MLYLRIKKIVEGILWVSWVASFVYSTDYSKLKASRPDTLFLCHTVQSFERFRRTKLPCVKQMNAMAAFVQSQEPCSLLVKKGVCSVFLKITADILFGRVLTQVPLYYLILGDFALIFSETNRPFVEVGHVLEYH